MSSSRARTTTSQLLALLVLSVLALAGCAADGTTGRDASAAGSALAGGLGEPTAAFPEDFGTIQTVRELPDGTLLVADPLGNALYHVDMDEGTRAVIGVEGEGPGEYRQPDAVWALPGGSSLLIDLGNGRTATLGPELDFGPTSPIAMGEPRPGSTLVLALPQGIDAQGRVYTRAMGGGFGGELPDSGAILRVDRETRSVDTVASFKLQDRIQTTSGGANNRAVSIESVPLSAEDAWGVAPDGSVVVARSSDYQVEWIGPDGTLTRGPATPFVPVTIGTAEKEEYVASTGRSGGGIGISVSVNNGAMQMNFARGAGGRPREIDNYQWPETKPPFYSGRLDVDGMGRAWVRRHVAAGEDATYDVFGRDGVRVGTVTLPNDRRVIGFGGGTVYAVMYDEFDLNYLERYALPGA
jgi:hypothetical protein